MSSGKNITASLGRIIEFPRKGVDASVNVRVNVMSKGSTDKVIERWNQQNMDGHNNSVSSSTVLGDANLLLLKKVAVFSTKAFENLKYCNTNPDQDVYCISNEYEQRDGLVTWACLSKNYDCGIVEERDKDVKKFGDLYQILGFDHREIEEDISLNDNMDVDDYGAPDPLNCSQEWYC